MLDPRGVAMSLTLILMRHAKSGWDDPTLDDFDRPLNGRGRTAAPQIAKWLAQKGYLPDTVLVSGARRTVETWDRMASRMPETATMESNPALYLAGSDLIMNVLKSQTAPSVMVICHNPGISDFAQRVVSNQPDHPDFGRYPTAATCVIAFEADRWPDITWNSGTLLEFVVSRDLTD